MPKRKRPQELMWLLRSLMFFVLFVVFVVFINYELHEKHEKILACRDEAFS